MNGEERKAVRTLQRDLLTTATGEPYQPVRLYYDSPSPDGVIGAFRRLHCMAADGACWVWLYRNEVRELSFQRSYAEIPPEMHPIVIGRFRFPEPGCVTLDMRSTHRAIEAVRFFHAHFDSRIVLRRVRLVNRLFDVSESSGVGSLDRLLDENVTVIEPSEELAKLYALVAPQGKRASPFKMAARLMAHLERREFPAVEDFPVAREDSADDFRQFTSALHLRLLLAQERWKGNQMTIVQVVRRLLGTSGAG